MSFQHWKQKCCINVIKAASLKNNKNIPHPPLLFVVKLWKFHLVPSKQETELIHYPKALTEPADCIHPRNSQSGEVYPSHSEELGGWNPV